MLQGSVTVVADALDCSTLIVAANELCDRFECAGLVLLDRLCRHDRQVTSGPRTVKNVLFEVQVGGVVVSFESEVTVAGRISPEWLERLQRQTYRQVPRAMTVASDLLVDRQALAPAVV